jgi:hypothetical protein
MMPQCFAPGKVRDPRERQKVTEDAACLMGEILQLGRRLFMHLGRVQLPALEEICDPGA